jgi:hypothetical protein
MCYFRNVVAECLLQLALLCGTSLSAIYPCNTRLILVYGTDNDNRNGLASLGAWACRDR